jgi:hypothetical protein
MPGVSPAMTAAFFLPRLLSVERRGFIDQINKSD